MISMINKLLMMHLKILYLQNDFNLLKSIFLHKNLFGSNEKNKKIIIFDIRSSIHNSLTEDLNSDLAIEKIELASLFKYMIKFYNQSNISFNIILIKLLLKYFYVFFFFFFFFFFIYIFLKKFKI